jgi:hypothetical protein
MEFPTAKLEVLYAGSVNWLIWKTTVEQQYKGLEVGISREEAPGQ